jgi:hypothetical protein
MWGLQNESTIPKEFAEECTQIIREMDPLSASQRIVTTCNGGEEQIGMSFKTGLELMAEIR